MATDTGADAGRDVGSEAAAVTAPVACQDLASAKWDALLAGAFSCAWMEPAPSTTGDHIVLDLTGVLTAGVPAPAGAGLFDGCTVSGGQRFAVQEPGGRRLTVAFSVEYGLTERPLAQILEALSGTTITLRYVASKRADWVTGFAARDTRGLAFAFDTGLRGHVLGSDDLGGLNLTVGPTFCTTDMGCARAFHDLTVTADQPVRVPPADTASITWRGLPYTVYNIRHHQETPGPQCPDAFNWMAWSLARR